MNGLIVNDATFSGGMTFLVGELEKLAPVVRQPLTSVTYPRDVRIIREGGWYQFLSNFNVNYAISGGVKNLQGGIQNEIARIQANLSKDTVKTSVFQSTLSLKWIDMQFNKMTG